MTVLTFLNSETGKYLEDSQEGFIAFLNQNNSDFLFLCNIRKVNIKICIFQIKYYLFFPLCKAQQFFFFIYIVYKHLSVQLLFYGKFCIHAMKDIQFDNLKYTNSVTSI